MYIGLIELLINLFLILLSSVILVLILESVKPSIHLKQPMIISGIWKIGISIGYGLSALVILTTITSLFIPFGWGFLTLFINLIIFLFLASSLKDIKKATVVLNYKEKINKIRKVKK